MAFIASGAGAGQEWKVSPNATSYIDMLTKVSQMATNQSVTTIGAIGTPGTNGYGLGDFLQIATAGAANPSALSGAHATFEVTGVNGGGQVTAVRLRQSGSYTTLPTNNGTANEFDTTILSGGGSGTVSISSVLFANVGWTETRITQKVASVAFNAIGEDYVASDVVTLTGGDTRTGFAAPQSANAATFTVTSVDVNGGITGIALTATTGIYHRNPGLTGIAVSGGSGTGATVNITMTDLTVATTDRELILTTPAPGNFPLGIRTFTNGTTIHNWEIMGMQTYVATSDWDAQVNRSPGRYPDNDDGAYVVLENEAFPYWMTINDRYIAIVFNLGVGIYSNMLLGAFDQIGTTAQYPQPVAVIGCSSVKSTTQLTTESKWAGMNLCVASDVTDVDGPGEILTPGGGWVTLRNGHDNNSDNIVFSSDFGFAKAIPGGNFDTNPTGGIFENQDIFIEVGTTDGLESWQNYCVTNDPAATSNNRKFTAMGVEAGTAQPAQFSVTLLDTVSSNKQALGELPGIRQVEQTLDTGSLNSEDCLDDGTNYWYVFQNCRLDETWSHFSMRGV